MMVIQCQYGLNKLKSMSSDDIKKFPEQEERVETGPVQFGDDWPGYFIRGDNVAALLVYFENYKQGNYIYDACLESMIKNMEDALI